MQKCHVFILHCCYTHYLHCSTRDLAWSTQIKPVWHYSDSLPVKSCHCTVSKNFTHQKVGSGPEPGRLAKASSPTAGDSPVAKKVKQNLDQAKFFKRYKFKS